MFQSKITLYVAAAVLAVFAYMGAELFSVTTSNKLLTAEVSALTAEKETKQAEVNTLANAVDVADRALSQMEKDRQLMVELHLEQIQSNQMVAESLAQNKAYVNNKLRQSEDEYVKAWSAAHMPGAAVRMYPYAEYTGNYPDGGAEATGVSNTAGKPAVRLLASNHF